MNWNTPNNEIKTFRLNPINAMIWPKAERFVKFQMPVPTESIDLSRFGNVKFWYNFWFHPETKSFQIIYIHINMFETLFPHSAILWCVFFVVLVKRIFFFVVFDNQRKRETSTVYIRFAYYRLSLYSECSTKSIWHFMSQIDTRLLHCLCWSWLRVATSAWH